MKRWHEDARIARRRRRVGKLFGVPTRWLQLGRLRKKHPLDCGDPHCPVCRHAKVRSDGLPARDRRRLRDE